MCKLTTSIPGLVEGPVSCLFGDEGQGREPSPDTKLISLIRTVVGRALGKCFRSDAFYSTAEDAVHKCVPEPTIIDVVAAKQLEGFPFTVLPS